jgi:hypothetical protein
VNVGTDNDTTRRADRRSFGEVLTSTIDDVRALVTKHVELARLEITEAASVRARGAGMFAAAAVIGLIAFIFVAAAGAAALDLVLPAWAAILIVGAVLVVIAGILALVGRGTIKKASAPGGRTKDTLKEDARWAKRQIAS